jgi:hypothetical protein
VTSCEASSEGRAAHAYVCNVLSGACGPPRRTAHALSGGKALHISLGASNPNLSGRGSLTPTLDGPLQILRLDILPFRAP